MDGLSEDCVACRENLAAYSLGALDAVERSALESHIESCDDCRSELAKYQQISRGLMAALSPRQPSPGLRRKLLRRLPGTSRPRFAIPHFTLGQAALGAALAVLIALNLFSLIKLQVFQAKQAGFVSQFETGQTALAMLAYPGTKTYPIEGQGVAGSLLMDADTNSAVLFVWNLPVLPANQAYQVWLIDVQGGRVSAGLFRTDASQPFTSVRLITPRSLSDFSGLGVTVEPARGSPGPSGQNVLKVNF